MKKLIFILGYFILVNSCYAQPGWFSQASPFTNITDLQFINAQTGFITGGSFGGQVAKTTNGGDTWTMIPVPRTELQMTSVEFINANTGWCCGSRAYPYPCCNYFTMYYKTTNGGQTWDSLPQGWGYKAFSDIHMFSKDSLLVGNIEDHDLSTSGSLHFTTNSGSTFSTPQYLNYGFGQVYSIRFINNFTGFYCSYFAEDYGPLKTHVFKTTDRGFSWAYIYKDTATLGGSSTYYPKKINDEFFVNENTGYICGEKGRFAKTTNGGQNWIDRNIGSTINFTSIHFFDLNTGYIAPNLMRTTDGGETWVTMGNSVLTWIKRFVFVDNLTGWAYNNTGLMKTVTGGVTAIEPISSIIPEKYFLMQNYPNPFNPMTNIRYDIPAGTGRDLSVQLKVYDANGKEVETLVNENQNGGSYSVSFNAVNYPSGVYFYKLTTGIFSETRKMILLK